MAKFPAKGTALAYLSGSTYVTVSQLDSIDIPMGDTDEADVTAFDSANSTREFLPTWKTTAPMSFGGFFDPGLADHAFIVTNHGGSAQTWKLTLTDTGTATEGFSAFVKDLQIQPDLNGALKFSFSLRPTGVITHTP